MDYNSIINSTISSLYNVSDLGFGSFKLAQISDFMPWDIFYATFGALKLFMAILMVLTILGLIWVIKKMNELNVVNARLTERINPPASASSGTNARWEEIQRHINSVREAEWKFAVIEADKLTDDTLKSAGFYGETMGERLMNIQPGQLTSLQSLWEAHKIRNRLVHDANYFLRYTEAKRAVNLYEKTLRELHAI